MERVAQEIEGGIRALLLGLGERLGMRVVARERMVAFIPHYAAYLVNRLIEGTDGKTGFERAGGEKPSIVVLDSGEKVLFKRKLGSKKRR